MHLGEADARADPLLGQPIADPTEDVFSKRLAAYVRENNELEQPAVTHGLHLHEQGIICRYQRLVIEGLLKPLLDWLEAAEIHDPVPSIKLVSFELQMHGECVAMEEPAV
jgi:hypothetical protein